VSALLSRPAWRRNVTDLRRVVTVALVGAVLASTGQGVAVAAAPAAPAVTQAVPSVHARPRPIVQPAQPAAPSARPQDVLPAALADPRVARIVAPVLARQAAAKTHAAVPSASAPKTPAKPAVATQSSRATALPAASTSARTTSAVAFNSVSATSGPTGLPSSTSDSTATYSEALLGVSCYAGTGCKAVGQYEDFATGNLIPWVMTWNGNAWSADAVRFSGSVAASLAAVSCSSSSDCWAVGDSSTTANAYNALALHWNGSAWSPVVVPALTGASLLDGVACVTSSDCWAVGVENFTSGGNDDGFALHWNGSAWTKVSAAVFTSNGGTFLYGVTCTASADCWAVGESDFAAQYTQVLAVHWDGTSWTQSAAVNPNATTSNQLFGVTCTASADCWAVGEESYTPPTPTIAEHWNGSTWSLTNAAAPGAGGNLLNGVTCVTSSDCWAAGSSSGDSTEPSMSFLNHWDGTAWASPAVVASSSQLNYEFGAVACPATGNCLSVGYAYDNETYRYQPVAARWNGSTWAMTTMPVLGAAPAPAETHGGSNPSEPCDSCALQRDGVGVQAHAGDPVNTATGDFAATWPLVDVKGRGAGLHLGLTYDAQLAKSQIDAGASAGSFGWGWSASVGPTLTVDSSSETVTVDQENGSVVTFVPATSTAACSSGSSTQCYTSSNSRVTATLSQALPNGNWTFSRDGGLYQLMFNASGQLISQVSDGIYTTSVAYNVSPGASSCPSSVVTSCTVLTDPAGRTLTIGLSGGRAIRVLDPAGNTWQMAYTTAGDLASLTDPLGHVTSFGYDTANPTADLVHGMTSWTRPNGQAGGPAAGSAAAQSYNSAGQVTQQTDAAGLITSFAYTGDNFSTAGGATTVTDPHGNASVNDYTSGVLTKTITGYSTSTPSTWTYTRDAATLLPAQITDPNGHTTSYSYDAQGNVLSQTDALGHTATSTFNNFNEPRTTTDVAGLQTVNTYDSYGDLLTSKQLASADPQTTYSYSDTAHPTDLTSVTSAAGHVTSYTYDNYGNLASTADHPSSTATDTTQLVSDVLGHVVCAVSAVQVSKGVACPAAGSPRAVGTNTYSYDADGQLTSSTDALGHTTSTSYDADSNKISTTDAAGNVTTYSYDPDDRPTSTTKGSGTSFAVTTRRSYDLTPGTTGCPAITGATYCASGTDGNGQTTLQVLDAKNLPVEQISSSGQSSTTSYDLAGNPTSQTGPTGTQTISYDADNRATGQTYGTPTAGYTAAPNVSFTYDAAGRRTQMVDGTGTTTYSYDPLGRLTSVTNGSGQTVGYGYDADNETSSLTYPNGQQVAHGYDNAGRLTSITDWLNHTTTYTYDADGNPTGQAAPNGTQVSTGYDVNDQPTSVSDTKGSTTLASISDTRNANGMVTTETSTGLAQPQQTYSYNPLNRLTSVNGAGYGYDNAGNPTAQPNATSQSYATTEQLTTRTTNGLTTAYTYDSNGDRTSAAPSIGQTTGYQYNQLGQLTSVTPGATTGAAAAGYAHTLAVRADGTVWAWGSDYYGQLGNGTTGGTSTSPVQVPGLATAVAAGYGHSVALRTDGTVAGWGLNTSGQLGNGSTANTNTPVSASGLTGVTAVAAGYSHSLALKSDGTVWAWGSNNNGQLGNGTTSTGATPTPAKVAGLSGVTAIAAGFSTSYALKSDGTVWAWGYGIDGELGNTSTTSSSTPGQVIGLTGVTKIGAGAGHALAVTSGGSLFAWGLNSNGQLGNGTTTSSPTPAQIPGMSGITNVGTGEGYYSLAVTNAGTVYAWGANGNGQLGNGTTTDAASPAQVAGLAGVVAVTAGTNDALALTSSGITQAWGYNTDGELGDGTTTTRNAPETTAFTTTPLLANGAISSGFAHTLAVRADGSVWAWGSNTYGQLGNATTGGTSTSPSQVPGVSAIAVAAGYAHSLAVTAGLTVYAWGANNAGQLGNGSTANTNTPVLVSGLGGVTALAAGYSHSLALKNDGTVWAWGSNNNGQLGNGSTSTAATSTPVRVSGLTGVVAIAAGFSTSYALKSDGTVWAWGYGADGELGNGTTTNSTTPSQVTGLTGVTRIGAGEGHALAVTSSGALYTWGLNGNGQLGNNNTTNSTTPIQVPGLTGVTNVGTGDAYYSLALKNDGTVWAWGANNYGQLGNGTTTDTHAPAQVTGVTGATSLTAGTYNPTVLTGAANAQAWGYNSDGELGDGTTSNHSTPETTQFTTRRAQPVSYAYDGDGLRASSTSTGSISRYTWDQSGTELLLAENSTSYIYGPGGSLAEQVGGDGTTVYLVHDQLGSSRAATSSTGAVVATWNYDAYGNLIAHTGVDATHLLFEGQYQDAGSGLYYLRARYYDPSSAQFLTADPLQAATLATYSYAANNPVNYADPTGLCTLVFFGSHCKSIVHQVQNGLAYASTGLALAATVADFIPGGEVIGATLGELSAATATVSALLACTSDTLAECAKGVAAASLGLVTFGIAGPVGEDMIKAIRYGRVLSHGADIAGTLAGALTLSFVHLGPELIGSDSDEGRPGVKAAC
jgi:RHS repeat-associated protein